MAEANRLIVLPSQSPAQVSFCKLDIDPETASPENMPPLSFTRRPVRGPAPARPGVPAFCQPVVARCTATSARSTLRGPPSDRVGRSVGILPANGLRIACGPCRPLEPSQSYFLSYELHLIRGSLLDLEETRMDGQPEPTTNAAASENNEVSQLHDRFRSFKPEFMTLHRYWVHANRLREYFLSSLMNPEWLDLAKLTGTQNNLASLNLAFMVHDPGIFMSYWYSSLYVVVEGWKELKLQDSDVDRLLGSPNVELLKRFRNGIFHYQRHYFDDRFTDFVSADDTVPWVNELTNAIGAYFRRQAGDTWPVLDPEVREKFRSLEPDKDQALKVFRTLLTFKKAQEADETVSSEP